jgi:type I restriction enzyme, S subunit
VTAITKAVPTIRFGSFSNEWKSDRLGVFFSSSRAKGFDGLPILSVTLDRGLVNRDDLERKQETNLTAGEHLLVQDSDIAYNTMRMWQGAFGRASQDGVVSPAYVVLRGKEGTDTRFFEYAFRRARSIYLFWAYSYGLTNDRLRLYANDFVRIPFSAPTPPEQRKIADFLTAVDRRIGQLIQKKAWLTDYKQGAMQQLFTQAIRLKDDHGDEFPDWEEKRLGTFLFERKEYQVKSEGLPHISLTVEGVVHKTDRYDRDFLVNDDASKKYRVTRVGDLCYNPANLKFGVIDFNELCDGIFSPIYITFEIRGIVPNYLKALIKRSTFLNAVRKYEQGTVYERQAVHPKDFVKGRIALPSIAEQTKIANFLSAIDRKIESVTTQINETQTFKKGLLQQMFV